MPIIHEWPPLITGIQQPRLIEYPGYQVPELPTLALSSGPVTNAVPDVTITQVYRYAAFTVVAEASGLSGVGTNATVSLASGTGNLSSDTSLTVTGVASGGNTVWTWPDLHYDANDAPEFLITPVITTTPATVTTPATAFRADGAFLSTDSLMQSSAGILDYSIVDNSTQTGGGGSDYEWTGRKGNVSPIQTVPAGKPVNGANSVIFAAKSAGVLVAELGGVSQTGVVFVCTDTSAGNNVIGGAYEGNGSLNVDVIQGSGAATRTISRRQSMTTRIGESIPVGTFSVSFLTATFEKNTIAKIRLGNTTGTGGNATDNTDTNATMGFCIGDFPGFGQAYSGEVFMWICMDPANPLDLTDAAVSSALRANVNFWYLVRTGASLGV